MPRPILYHLEYHYLFSGEYLFFFVIYDQLCFLSCLLTVVQVIDQVGIEI